MASLRVSFKKACKERGRRSKKKGESASTLEDATAKKIGQFRGFQEVERGRGRWLRMGESLSGPVRVHLLSGVTQGLSLFLGPFLACLWGVLVRDHRKKARVREKKDRQSQQRDAKGEKERAHVREEVIVKMGWGTGKRDLTKGGAGMCGRASADCSQTRTMTGMGCLVWFSDHFQ